MHWVGVLSQHFFDPGPLFLQLPSNSNRLRDRCGELKRLTCQVSDTEKQVFS